MIRDRRNKRQSLPTFGDTYVRTIIHEEPRNLECRLHLDKVPALRYPMKRRLDHASYDPHRLKRAAMDATSKCPLTEAACNAVVSEPPLLLTLSE